MSDASLYSLAHPTRVCEAGRQAGSLPISVINLNLSAKVEVKAERGTEGGGLKGNCTPAAPL